MGDSLASPQAAGPPEDRRTFLRSFGRRSLQSVGAAIQLQSDVRRNIADSLGAYDSATDESSSYAPEVLPSLGAWAGQSAWPPHFDLAGDLVRVPVQTYGTPSVGWCETRTVGELTQAMRSGRIDGGPVLAQAATLGMAQSARHARFSAPAAAHAAVVGAARAIAAARQDLAIVGDVASAAVEAWRQITTEAGTLRAAEVLQYRAAMYTKRFESEHRQLAQHAAAVQLARARSGARRELEVGILLHGEMGSRGSGTIGASVAALRAMADVGPAPRVTIVTWQAAASDSVEEDLASAGLPHVRCDAASVGALIRSKTVGSLLLGVDELTRGGDLISRTGAFALALLARELGIPVYACPTSAIRTQTDGPPPSACEPSRTSVELVPKEFLTAYWTDLGICRPASFAPQG